MLAPRVTCTPSEYLSVQSLYSRFTTLFYFCHTYNKICPIFYLYCFRYQLGLTPPSETTVPGPPGCIMRPAATFVNYIHIYSYICRVSQEEWTKLRDSVPYVKLYRYNPKHLYPKSNGYGDNGHRKVWASGVSTYCKPSVTPYSSTAHARQRETTS